MANRWVPRRTGKRIAKPPTKEIMLLEKGTLDEYIFDDGQHAQEWLSQYHLKEDLDSYRVALVVVKRSACCGAVIATKTLKMMTAQEFLKQWIEIEQERTS
jgi:hypothetical protein